MSNPSSGRLELIVRNLIPEDMANYTCKSSNVVGYHEKNGTITVNCKQYNAVWCLFFQCDNLFMIINLCKATMNGIIGVNFRY